MLHIWVLGFWGFGVLGRLIGCSLRCNRRQSKARGGLLRIAGRSHVPLHSLRHVPGAVGCGRRHRRYRRQQGFRRAVLTGQAHPYHVRRAGTVCGFGVGRGGAAGSHPGGRLLPRRPRAVPDRLLHRIERGRPAAGAREHGAIRCAQTYRGLCDSHRLQLQPGWQHAVSLVGFCFPWRRPRA